MPLFFAVDLGATSGRVSVGDVTGERIAVREVHRFPNRTVQKDGSWYWDVDGLWSETLTGLRSGLRFANETGHKPAGVAADSWGVDVAAVNPDGVLVGRPRSYRSASTAARDAVVRRVPAAELFRRAGVQPMPINTLFQLADLLPGSSFPDGTTLLLIADLWTFQLSGDRAAERTLASTTGLMSARSGAWDPYLLKLAGVDRSAMPPIVDAATSAGTTCRELTSVLGSALPVFRVGAHDTASAVAALPLEADEAFISCGTWALAGVEHDEPVLSEAALASGFTNEAGVAGRTLVMRNLTGLWLIEQSLMGRQGPRSLSDLLAAAAVWQGTESFIDVGDPDLVHSPDVPAHIRRRCAATGQPSPEDLVALVRCILVSLALAYRNTIRQASALTGRKVGAVRVVGGGSRNALLCRLTADACGVPVLAGPAEATTLGNIGVQAIAAGVIDSLAELRTLIRRFAPPIRYEPGESTVAWERGDAVLGAR